MTDPAQGPPAQGPPAQGPRTPWPSPDLRRNALTLGLFLLVSAAWSWPLVTSPGSLSVARQFDLPGTIWAAWVATRLDPDLHTTLAGWPVGVDLRRGDSHLWLLIGATLGRLVSPARLVALVALIGPALSAWAAERFAARALGAAWPWSLVAGLAYAFTGLSATALLEGHQYLLLVPWLPLLAWQWHEATGPGGRVRHGLLAGGAFVLCLMSSAYVGIAGALWVLVWAGASLARRALRPLPVLAAGAVVAPVGLLYARAFSAGGGDFRSLDSFGSWGADLGGMMAAGSASLVSLAGADPTVDLAGHSMVHAIGMVPLALCAAAPALARRGELGELPWRRLLLLVALGLALALGPRLKPHMEPVAPWLLAPLGWFSWSSFFRFPGRLVTVAALAAGGLAAVVLSRLARPSTDAGPDVRPSLWPPGPALVLAMAALDVFLVTGLPGRAARLPLEAPQAYRTVPAQGALLTLTPQFVGLGLRTELLVLDGDCAWQHVHGRPVVHRCLDTARQSGPLWAASSWLRGALLQGAPGAEVAQGLAALGIGSVSWRPDLFAHGDRALIGQGLRAALGEPVGESRNGGEHVLLFAVPSPASEEQARAAWAALGVEG